MSFAIGKWGREQVEARGEDETVADDWAHGAPRQTYRECLVRSGAGCPECCRR